MGYFALVSISLFGGWIGHKSKIPMGSFLMALTLVGIWKVLTNNDFDVDSNFRFFAQVLLGTIIGVSLNQFKKEEIKTLFKGLIIITLSVLTLLLLLSLVLHHYANLPLDVALVSAAPGSIAEMSTLASSLNIDALTVVIFHVFRVMVTVFSLSLFIKFMVKKERGKDV